MKNSLEIMFPEVAKQWSTRNFPLLPKDVSYGSNKKIWWRGECGHEWQASPHSRTGKNSPGCPYCSGNRVLAGFNDLASRFPEIAAEWSEQNYPLRPDEVTAFSNKKAWWKGKCGHEWYALISSRSDGHGCPYCEDHKLLKGFNDFASQYPQLAKEWSEKNKVGADAVTSSKAGLFWWHCPSCGGEYSAWISSRIDGSRCPYCTGRVVEENLNSLSKTHPAIAAEWNCEKNRTVTADQVSALSKQEYWWKSSCGHEWKAKIYDRTMRKVPCPKCEQEFVYVLPQLLVMLYTGQNHLKVEFDTDDLTGIRMEMYIPELNLAIEERSPDERNHEQKVKRYICELQDVRYILYEPFKSTEDAAAFIRTILKEHHVHIKTAAADDIALCREKYNLLKRRKLR